MENIKDYVFLIIPKTENWLEDIGSYYGIKKGYSKDHEYYYSLFLENYSFLYENLNLFSDWGRSMEEFARNGNVAIVNSAVEIEEENERLYVIYLPTFPNIYQLIQLSNVLEQLNNIEIDVSVYGVDEEVFKIFRLNNEFNSKEFLKRYIKFHKISLLENINCFYECTKERKKIYTKL